MRSTKIVYAYEPVVVTQVKKPYGCLAFLGDIFMTLMTGGFWLIWIFVREMRRR